MTAPKCGDCVHFSFVHKGVDARVLSKGLAGYCLAPIPICVETISEPVPNRGVWRAQFAKECALFVKSDKPARD